MRLNCMIEIDVGYLFSKMTSSHRIVLFMLHARMIAMLLSKFNVAWSKNIKLCKRQLLYARLLQVIDPASNKVAYM